jgi:hypothetical protein
MPARRRWEDFRAALARGIASRLPFALAQAAMAENERAREFLK